LRVAFVVLLLSLYSHRDRRALHSFPTRRSSDLSLAYCPAQALPRHLVGRPVGDRAGHRGGLFALQSARPAEPPRLRHLSEAEARSEEHTSELQSRENLVCRLLLEKKKELPTSSGQSRQTRNPRASTPRHGPNPHLRTAARRCPRKLRLSSRATAPDSTRQPVLSAP